MGEALIIKAGGDIYNKATGGGSSSGILQTEIFTESGTFIVPKARNQSFSVRIFGGGGAGGQRYNLDSVNTSNDMVFFGGGGGGGFMNNATLVLEQGQAISIGIGAGGIVKPSVTSNGGTTAFGTYLSALGGCGGESTSGFTKAKGGSGGSGGGGGNSAGGTGHQFGGGGGGHGTGGGNGGYYGGGGGGNGSEYSYGGVNYYNMLNLNQINGRSGLCGNGSANCYTNAINGTNTIGMGLEFEGAGICGTSPGGGGGGGGYGGNGGNVCGGGGGYGGNGGNGYQYNAKLSIGGGGGGYGGDGGDAGNMVAGGGGGYGKGGYGGGASGSLDGGIGAGGAGCGVYANKSIACPVGNGGNGICIIQYYSE